MESFQLGKLIVLLMLIIPMVNAVSYTDDSKPEFIFAQGKEANIIDTCSNVDDSPCSSDFSCNLTIAYPNSSIMVNNKQMSWNQGFYNFSLPNTNTLGLHSYAIYCTNGTNSGIASELYYLVNLTGEDFNIQKAILYIFVLIITLVLTLLCLYGAIKIPWKNKRGEDGYIVGMNDLKYVKLLLWFVTYLFFLFATWLTFLVSKFLELGMTSKFFEWIYLFLLVFLFPVFIITTLSGIISYFNDKKTWRMLERNIRMR